MRKAVEQQQTIHDQISAIAHRAADEVEAANFYLTSLSAIVSAIARLNKDPKANAVDRELGVRDLIALGEFLAEQGRGATEQAQIEMREIAEGVSHG